MLGLIAGTSPPPEVTVPTTADRGRPGIVIHRVKQLHVLDTALLDQLPITPVPRILVDLAASAGPDELSRLCHQAWVWHGVSAPEVEACAARAPCKPGLAELRDALRADVTLSKLEDAFVALLSRNSLPLPRTNIDHHGHKVDCHWPKRGLTVELVSTGTTEPAGRSSRMSRGGGVPVTSPSATATSRSAGDRRSPSCVRCC